MPGSSVAGPSTAAFPVDDLVCDTLSDIGIIGFAVGRVENEVSDIKMQVAGGSAQMPHLPATSDLKEVRIDVAVTKAQLSHGAGESEVMEAMAPNIQWGLGTTLAAASLALAIARFVH